MAFISIGKVDRNLISILIGCIFCTLDRLLNEYVEVSFFDNSILTEIVTSISYLFTIIPLIILKFRSKKIKSIDLEVKNENRISYAFSKTNSNKNIGKYGFFLLSTTLYFTQSTFYTYTFKIKTNSWIFEILITSILYNLIFKQKIYKHHYLSIISIILIGLIIDLILGNLQKDISENILLLVITLFREILKSFNYIVDKYNMDKKFASVYEISFFKGLIDIIYLIIFSVLDYYYFNYFGSNDFENYFNNFKIKELIGIIGTMITQLGLYLSILYTNKNYTTCHIFIIFVFGQIVYYIDFSVTSIIVFILLLVILFFLLVFNEIIEINFCGLSDNTKRNIRDRAEKEVREGLFIAITDNFSENSEKEQEVIELDDYIIHA